MTKPALYHGTPMQKGTDFAEIEEPTCYGAPNSSAILIKRGFRASLSEDYMNHEFRQEYPTEYLQVYEYGF